MLNRKSLAKSAAAFAVVLLVGCGSSDLGGVLGGGGGNNSPSSYPSTQSSSLLGTVDNVDTRNQTIDLTTGNGRRETVAYDSRTRVTYRNENGTPAQLERGDQIDVRVVDNGNGRWVADSINVTYSVSDNSGNSYPNGGYPSGSYPNGGSPSSTTAQGDIVGTINYLDTTNQRIELSNVYRNNLRNTSGTGSDVVYYDSRTRVYYQNETHPVSDLERGDQISVRVFTSGGRVVADTITVTRNVRQ